MSLRSVHLPFQEWRDKYPDCSIVKVERIVDGELREFLFAVPKAQATREKRRQVRLMDGITSHPPGPESLENYGPDYRIRTPILDGME
jgi:hypothetical protein